MTELNSNQRVTRRIERNLDIIIKLYELKVLKGYSFEDRIKRCLKFKLHFCPICDRFFELPFRTHAYLKHEAQLTKAGGSSYE